MSFLTRWIRHTAHAPNKTRAHLTVECLESRVVPYNVVSGPWPNPQLITISFMPDGTDTGGGVPSNLFATFNARWPTATWQGQILKAAQQWAAATNINFAVVPDNGAPEGSGNNQQGDPGFGDVRIGGYNFGTGDLAGTAYPPPINNFSVAGDMFYNTSQPFNIGATYDLFSVAMHEFGHAIGLGLSNAYGSVENAAYQKRTGLGSDDLAGARAIYSGGAARSYDAYLGLNSTLVTATGVSIDPNSLTALVTNLNLAKPGQAEYFSFVVPQGTNGSLTATVQSSGLSLLSPTLTLYNGLGGLFTQVGSASGAGQYGTTISVHLSGVSAGQVYYAKVTGADTSAFSTGAYALTVNAGSGPAPVVPLPNTTTPNGNPLQAGGGSPQAASPADVNDSLANQAFNPSQATINRLAAPAVAAYQTSAGLQNAHAATITVVSSGSGFVLSTSTPSTFDNGSPVSPRNDATVESGGGGLSDASEATLPSITPSESGGIPSAPEFTAPDAQASQTFPNKSAWQDACTACFARETVLTLSKDSATAELALGKDQPDQAFSPGAALIGSALILGNYWGNQTERMPESRRRKPRLS